MQQDTLAIHGANRHTEEGEHVYPIFQTSTFMFENVDQGANRFAGKEKGGIYTRLGNPNYEILTQRLAMMEEGDLGLIFPSGMAAIATVLEYLLAAGDHLIINPIVYGCTDHLVRSIIKKYNVEVSYVDTANIEEVKKNLKDNTKVVFLETPANPTLDETDVKEVCDAVKLYNKDIKVVVDNTFATPVYLKPLTMGADIVVHSCTKYINGHGDVVAGAAIFNKDIAKDLTHTQIDMGTVASPFDCWLMLRGLKTLPLRMKQHTENAKRVVEFLKGHEKVEKVVYPGYSGMITFYLNGGYEAGKNMLNNVKLCGLAVSLGNVDSLICHPASMTHAVVPKEQREKVGITDSLVRLSVGIENVEDIIADLEQALNKIN